MVRTHRARRLIAVLVVLVLAGTACSSKDKNGGTNAGGSSTSSTADAAKPVRGGTLVYAVEGDTLNPWDPAKMLCAASCHSTIGRTIFEPLAMIDADGNAVPYLLESITPNPDATEFKLVVRKGIKFHDGTDLNADAVAFNLERQRTQSPLIGPAIKLVTGFTSDGDSTVTVALSKPWSAFPYALNSQLGYVGSPKWEAAADADPKLVTQPVGTGPFKFASYEPDGNLKATRFADYWRGDGAGSVTKEGLPYLDGIEVRFIESAKARTDALKSGAIDLLQTANALEIRDLKKASGITVDVMDDPLLTETTYFLINNAPTAKDQPNPLSDINVRKALAMATDYESLTAARAPGFEIANGPFPKGTDGYLADTGAPKYDLEGAKKLVKDYEAKNGPLKVAYKTTDDPANLKTAEVVQAMWQKAGVDVTFDSTKQGDLIGEAIGGNFQVFGWRNHAGADPDQQYTWWTSENTVGLALNFGRIKDPALDALMLKIRTSTDDAVRKQAAEDVNKLFATNVYNIWTNWVYWVFAHGDKVHGAVGPGLPGGGTAINMGANLPGVIMPATIFKSK